MTPAQILSVKNSFALVRPISDQAAAMFYDRLFTLDPGLRRLFKSDISEQGKKLMQTIAFVVGGLDKLDTIVPAVQELGARHSQYGVEDSHYDTVAQALLWTLQQGLGEAFTADVKQAWTAAYALLASVMKAACKGRSAPN